MSPLFSSFKARRRAAKRPWNQRLPRGYDRIYHVHVRKSAGTSLNAAFWSLGGLDLRSFEGNRQEANGLVFVRHHADLIEQGDYYYANSHVPLHRLKLPARTFRITILRDPLRRLVSHYRYIRWAATDPRAPGLEPAFPSLAGEIEWLGDRFVDFVRAMPRERREGQLHMFSAGYDVDEALKRLRECEAVLHTETFAEDFAALKARLGLEAPERRERRFGDEVSVGDDEAREVRELLAAEYDFYRRVR